MVVIATPSTNPLITCDPNLSAAPVLFPESCAQQDALSAPVSKTNGVPVLTRTRAVSVTQGQAAHIDWNMIDSQGRPVDLRPCGFGGEDPPVAFKVVFRLKEQLALGNTRPPLQLDTELFDAETGRVRVQLTKEITKYPGIYYGEMALIDNTNPDENPPPVVFSNIFSVIINRSTFGPQGNQNGPPSIAEIRLHLRDSSPAESYLLEHVMFDDAEIALAITRPVMYWNEVPPPLDNTYNTQNFPFRYHWLEGICANLFFMVAEQYRRNQLGYSAAGMSIDDQNKEASYERAGQARWQAYREWVRATKASINLESCYGEVTSNYKYSAYTDAIRIRY
ncbi:hypothetical protein EBZ39_05900 [bacterium]|nr:hypothetical protein [bacterium]